MTPSRLVVPAVLAALVGLAAACAEEGPDGGRGEVGTTESAVQITTVKLIGPILAGETLTGEWETGPAHRAFSFRAKGGNHVLIDVKSVGGDAVGYLTDEAHNVLAQNDDASPATKDARLEWTMPEGAPARELRIVFRDFDRPTAKYRVKLTIEDAGDLTCSYAGQGYGAGDSFPSTDGCNTCTCGASGAVACTKLTCACNPTAEPDHTYVGTPKQCVTLHYSCPLGQVPFANSCGCGCKLADAGAGPG